MPGTLQTRARRRKFVTRNTDNAQMQLYQPSAQNRSSIESEYLYRPAYLDSLITDPGARSLSYRIQSLNQEFQELNSERDSMQQKFMIECGQSLQQALSYMQDLIEHVTEADKSLVYWYTRGTPLRLAFKVLKPIGRDRDAGTIMLKKADGIRSRADLVSKQFDDCSTLCLTTLSSVQDLHLRTNHFVEVGIGGAREEARDLVRDYQRKKEDLQLSISQKELDVSTVQREASNARQVAASLQAQEQKARRSASNSRKLSGASIGFGIFLGLGCLLFPPAGAVLAGIGAASAGAIGVSSAIVSRDHSFAARDLYSEESSFRRKISNLESEISRLRSQINTFELSQYDYDKAMDTIRMLERECETLQSQMQQFMGELNFARAAISRGVMNTQAVASALYTCEYGRVRKDFVQRLQGVLNNLRPMIGETLVGQSRALSIVETRLGALDRSTGQVVRILAKGFR